jgi:plastocyanin
MSPELFFWIGSALALLAVVTAFLGLREKTFPGSRGAMVGTLALFIVLVLGATTFAVVNARDEQEHREAELAEEAEAPEEEAAAEDEEAAAEGGGAPSNEVGMVEYAFEPADVRISRGDTVTGRNDGQTAHNLTVLEGNEELGATENVDPGQSAELEVDFDPGEYELICTIPGHADLGMVGTFTVE